VGLKGEAGRGIVVTTTMAEPAFYVLSEGQANQIALTIPLERGSITMILLVSAKM
jgi:hypothetical protein